MMLYKVLSEAGQPIYGGSGTWSLPTKRADGTWEAGEWMPPIKRLAMCESGYHVVTLAQLPQWLGPAIYETEVRGEHLDADDKFCWQEVRLMRRIESWTKCTARLFVCDCAEHVLPIWAALYPNDERPQQAIAVARRYAMGEATAEELAAARAAARAAVGDAAWAAAWAAARDAAWAAGRAARDAAWAARAAARAAWDAAMAAMAAMAATSATSATSANAVISSRLTTS